MKKILNGNSVMMWVRISESRLPAMLAIGAVAIGIVTVAGAYGVGYLKAIRSERKKQSEPEKTEEVPSEDGVIDVDFSGETEAVKEEDPVTEEDKGNLTKGVEDMFLHDHSLHAAIGATVGLAYLAFRLKYKPVNDWGQLCYRTNSFNLEANKRICQGLMDTLRKCADGASTYAASGNEEATKALAFIGGDINDILNDVGSIRREDFGYRW
jgi:hypothetical protein